MHLFVQQKTETSLQNATAIFMLSFIEQFLAPALWPRAKQARKMNLIISYILDNEINSYALEL